MNTNSPVRSALLPLLLPVFLVSAASPVALASDCALKVRALDGLSGDHFGGAVAISGNIALIGARLDDHPPQGGGGSAYLYDVVSGAQLAKLLPQPFPSGDVFGSAVAIDGSTAVVGAPQVLSSPATGYASVFDAVTGQWVVDLTANDEASFDQFGATVGVSGTTAVVGAFRDDDNGTDSGSAYLFDTITGQQLHKLLPTDGAATDWFGISADISGNIVIVGAYLDDDNGNGSGSAYLFDATTGQQTMKLLPDDGAANDDFGISVAISGNVAIVGAVFNDDNGVSSGSAYLFDVTTGQQLHKLLPDDGLAGDWFGINVSISGNRAMVGAERKDGAMNEAGAAYVFDVATGNQTAKLVAGDAAHFDRLGSAVAISGATAVAGSYGDDPPSGVFADQGSAYLFDLDPGVWCNVGGGTLGSSGQPTLSMSGTLAPASLTTLDLVDANPSATTLLFGAFASTPAPFLGGLLYPWPASAQVFAFTSALGTLNASVVFPGGAPPGTQIWFQAGVVDPSVPFHGASLSNAVRGTTP